MTLNKSISGKAGLGLVRWLERRAVRLVLSRLDAALLRDIGVTRVGGAFLSIDPLFGLDTLRRNRRLA